MHLNIITEYVSSPGFQDLATHTVFEVLLNVKDNQLIGWKEHSGPTPNDLN